MIQILATEFIRRNTELLKILKGMYDQHVKIITEAQRLEKLVVSLEKEIVRLNAIIKVLQNKKT